MKTGNLLLSILSFCFFGLANGGEHVSQIRSFVTNKEALGRIWSSGIDHEGVEGKIGGWMYFIAAGYEKSKLNDLGVPYEVVIEDLASYYEQRLQEEPALGFGYGSMGGFYTNTEVVEQLDSMQLQFPNLITVRDSIGYTQQNRTMWSVKISDNPGVNEPGEPEVLYTALHHAREPQGMMTVLYYMWWLLENYGSDPGATYLVNNRQMWFIPVVNPDGYTYNEQTNPNGGGLWRKNRRNNGGGSFGVDPNRNYGPEYMWNANNGGSSTDPNSDTYRGPTPFSEPENQAIDRFMRAHNIKTAFNYHTYSNLLIYPFGYLSQENGDSLIYRDWAYDCTAANHYAMGTDLQTVNYSTRGNSDDYMFGDMTKPVTYTMTPEVGSTGFWPSQSEIFPLAIENLPSNKFLSYVAGHYPTIRGSRIEDDGGNGFLDRGESFDFVVTMKNRGLANAANLNIGVSSSTPFVAFDTAVVLLDSFPAQTTTEIRFAGSVAGASPTGIPVDFYISFSDPDGFSKTDTLSVYAGTPAVVFADSASNGTGNWTTGQGWGLTSRAHSSPNAFTDSPSGDYNSNANNSLTTISQINLTGYDYAQLRFWTQWATEPTWDFATVELSTNNGGSWTTLRTTTSTHGSGRDSQQPSSAWGYDSYTPGLTWLEQDADLTPYVNRQIKLRFRIYADGFAERDGFYVDDLRIHGYTTETDTGVAILPTQFVKSGVTGTVFVDSVLIANFTDTDLEFTIAETTSTPGLRIPHKARSPLSIETFTTIIEDARNENSFGASDIYRVDHQSRSFLGTLYDDFRLVLEDTPDSNIVVFLSIDTDQDFGTGAFPTPSGIGLSSRDIGSEREIILDASGLIIDTLTGLGRIPAGIVINTETDSIVGLPFLLTVERDSVLTISTNAFNLGIHSDWLGDDDANMLVGAMASRLTQGVSPLPDFAPAIGHGVVGGETNVTWLSEDSAILQVPEGQSAVLHVTTLAANEPGTYDAGLNLATPGRPATFIPITLTVTGLGIPQIALSVPGFSDTVQAGESAVLTLEISNPGSTELLWVLLDTGSTEWVSINPVTGTTAIDATSTTIITLSSDELTAGSTYSTEILIFSNDPSASILTFPLSLRVDPPTSAEGETDPLPVAFALRQNYPNPFNPETTIGFDLPRSAFTTLKVFNIIGQEVASLVEAQLPAGRHSVSVNGLSLPSGVYMYRLKAEDFTQTRKMVLLR